MSAPTPRTPHYKLYLTEPDRRGWQDQYYENMRIIDSAISSFGAISNFMGVWANSTSYSKTMRVTDSETAFIYEAAVPHTSSEAPMTFSQERLAHPTYWSAYSFGGGGSSVVSGITVHTDVPASVTSVLLLDDNPARTGAAIYNDSAAELLVNLGPTASNSTFTVSMLPGSYFETPYGYIGAIAGIWSEVSGNARVTEFTP